MFFPESSSNLPPEAVLANAQTGSKKHEQGFPSNLHINQPCFCTKPSLAIQQVSVFLTVYFRTLQKVGQNVFHIPSCIPNKNISTTCFAENSHIFGPKVATVSPSSHSVDSGRSRDGRRPLEFPGRSHRGHDICAWRGCCPGRCLHNLKNRGCGHPE